MRLDQKRKRVLNPMEWPKIIYEVVGAKYPVLSLALVTILGAFVFGGGWWLLGKQYQKEHHAAATSVAQEAQATIAAKQIGHHRRKSQWLKMIAPIRTWSTHPAACK